MVRLWPIVAISLLFGCSQAPNVEVEEEQIAKTNTDFQRLSLVLGGILKSEDIALYEGLPGEFWDPELRRQELTQKKTVKFHGYPFYEAMITLQGADAEPLGALLSATSSFSRHRGPKKCGGYNPDYCLQWKKGDAVTQVLVSLECGEVKLFGPKSELLCDLSPDAQKKLTQLLKPYQKIRPSSESTP